MFFTGYTQGGLSVNSTAMFEQQATTSPISSRSAGARCRNRGAHARKPRMMGAGSCGESDYNDRILAGMHARPLQRRGRREISVTIRRALRARLLRLRPAAQTMARPGRSEGPCPRDMIHWRWRASLCAHRTGIVALQPVLARRCPPIWLCRNGPIRSADSDNASINCELAAQCRT